MTVLHYLIDDYHKYFDVALYLIEKHKADLYLLDNKNRNGFMKFVIELNSGNYYQEDFDGFGNDSKEISVKVMNRLLMIYDCNIIQSIIDYILPLYKDNSDNTNDKYINILVYLLDVVTDNIESYKKLYAKPKVASIYEYIFTKYLNYVFNRQRRFIISPKNVYYKHFKYMLEKFDQNKMLLKREKYGCYDDLIRTIHIFIFYLYDECYYDETKRKSVKYIIKYKYPINLLMKMNESILHTLFDEQYDKVANNERAKAFISFTLTSTNFKHLNLKTKSTLLEKNTFEKNTFTPLSLAVQNDRRVDIIKLLLDNDSTIGSLAFANLLNSLISFFKHFSKICNPSIIVSCNY